MSENPEEKKKQNINVQIDTRETERLVRENEQLKQKLGKSEDDIAELKLKMYKDTGEVRYLDCQTKEEMKNLTDSLFKETVERRKGIPSGHALTDAQYGKKEGLFSQKFDSEKEMVDTILEYMHSEDPKKAEEGKSAYEQFMRKWIQDKRSNPTRPEPNYNPNTPESLLDLDLVEKDGFLTPRNKEDGDAQKLQKRWREERKRRIEGNKE
jgi:hypothetical protein